MKLGNKADFKIGSFINVVLGVFVFTALIGTIATQITAAQSNLSGGASILLGLTTLILVIGLIMSIMRGQKIAQ